MDFEMLPVLKRTKHIPGHVVLMVVFDDRNIYVHDNSRPEVEMIPWGDLQQAWAADYIGISKKNAYFGIDMQNPNRDISSIIQKGLSGIHSGVPNTYQGGRDKLAAAMLKYQDTIGTAQWSMAAKSSCP